MMKILNPNNINKFYETTQGRMETGEDSISDPAMGI